VHGLLSNVFASREGGLANVIWGKNMKRGRHIKGKCERKRKKEEKEERKSEN
jgi:hypothetical protein